MADPLSIATGVLSIVGLVVQVASRAIGLVDKTVAAHGSQRKALRNMRYELYKTAQRTRHMKTALSVMLGDHKDNVVKRLLQE